MKKYILQIALTLSIFFLIILVLIPYFTQKFSNIREKKAAEENYQNQLVQKAAEEKEKKDAEEKIYLTGKFDPAKRDDFVLIPSKYTLGGIKMYVREETYSAFLEMEKAALTSGVDLRIVSATRNFDYQKNLWNNKWTGITFVDGQDLSKSIPDGTERFAKILEYSAVPTTSRHHWGTELDINGVSPTYFDTAEGMKEYDWLVQNAPSFGFCQTYNVKSPDGRVTGYNEEKWHWSYLPLSRTFTQEYKDLVTDADISGFDGDQYVKDFDLIDDYVLGINPECL